VFALVERHVRDALEESGVVLQCTDVRPSDLVVSISALLETNGASASSLDLMICFRSLVLIFQLRLDRQLDECFFRRD